jgi:hypothetical protein
MIHLIQWLCPNRHCLLAVAYDPEDQGYDISLAGLKQFAISLGVKPECFLCGSTQLVYEDAATVFNTMEEAIPHLEEQHNQNMRARLMMNAIRKASLN